MEPTQYYKKNNALPYLLIFLLFLAIVFIFIGKLKDNSDVENNQSISQEIKKAEETGRIVKLEIEPIKVPCLENTQSGCFVANNELFIFSIKGFRFEEGMKYKLEVVENEDSGYKRYFLKKVLSKQKANDEEKKQILKTFGNLSEFERRSLDIPKPKAINSGRSAGSAPSASSIIEQELDKKDKDDPAVSRVVDDRNPSISAGSINQGRVGEEKILTMKVSSEYVDCGNGIIACIMVDGKVFYGDIEGFVYQPGFNYVIKVKRTVLNKTSTTIGNYKYELLEIISKQSE